MRIVDLDRFSKTKYVRFNGDRRFSSEKCTTKNRPVDEKGTETTCGVIEIS